MSSPALLYILTVHAAQNYRSEGPKEQRKL